MGRTLHYSVQGGYKPVDKEDQALIDLAKAYNWKYDWTCEDVQLTTLDYFLNRSHWDQTLSEKEIWKIFHDRYNHLINEGLNDVKVIKSLNKAGLINLYHDDELRGFTKVRGNEMNAHQVIQFMIDASKLLPERVFVLHDEGDALYCPVLLRDGTMKPDYESIRESLEYWRNNDFLHSGGLWDVSSKEEYYKTLLQLNYGWGDSVQYIRPLNEKSVFVERKKVQTINLSLDEAENLPVIMSDFLITEAKESEQYYEDTKSFPQLKGRNHSKIN